MSVTKRRNKKTENNITEHYESVDDRCSSKHCRAIDEGKHEEWTKVIAEMKFNRSMITHSDTVGVTCDENFNHNQPVN